MAFWILALFMAIILTIVACSEDVPTPTPVPTATPAPTATPVPPYAAVWNSLEHTIWLDGNDPDSASAIKSFAWVADGIDDAEREDVQRLAYLAAARPVVFDVLITRSWVVDGPGETERELVAAVRSIADGDESAAVQVLTLPFLETIELDDDLAVKYLVSLAAAEKGNNFRVLKVLVEKPWVADGLDEAELRVLDDIRLIVESDESAALQTLALPFLDTVEPDDRLTVGSILRLVVSGQGDSPNVFNALIVKSWVPDGLDETERVIVGNLRGIAYHDESTGLQFLASPFLDTIEPADRVTMETLLAFRQDFGQQISIDPISALIEKSWVADGLDPAEQEIVADIRRIADKSKSASLRVIALPFLDTLEPDDGPTVESLAYLAEARKGNNFRVFDALIEKPWVPDGLNENELKIVANIRSAADSDESAALQILELPFLDAVEPDDRLTIGSLLRLVTFRQGDVPNIFNALIEKSWVADGLDEDERVLVGNIRRVAVHDNAVALKTLASPFLETIEPDDSVTMEVLLSFYFGQRLSREPINALIEKSWVADGLDPAEQEMIGDIRWILDNSKAAGLQVLALPFLDTFEPGDSATVESFAHLLAYVQGNPLSIFDALVEMSWVADGFNETELEAVSKIWSFTDNDESVALAILAKPWIADGFDGVETEILEDIRWIADNEESAALRILDMPFLDAVQTSDRYAVAALNRIARHSRDHSLRLMQHPLIHDGISDRMARIIPVLPHFVNKDEPDWDLVDILLEPNNDLLEERTITLPLAGEVALALIRTTPGSPRNMGYLEHAVRVNEEFTGVPFPTDYVAVLFADVPGTGGGGSHYGSHIVAGLLHDNGGDDYVTTYSHGLLAHETAHYYWRYGKIWINEGAASFMTEIAQLARIGRFWRDHFVLCAHVDTIAELDEWSPSYGEVGSECHYALGERLFMDLYSELGDAEFRKGFRTLYLLTQVQGDECEGTSLNICHLRAAFVHGADEEAAAIAQRVIARWYDGTEPYAPTEVIPPDPFIPSIDGRVRTFMSARHGGASIEGLLSASDMMPPDQPHLRLTLNYNYPSQEPNREVEFKVLTYFEDGFAFHSNSVSFTLQSGHRGVSSQWVAVGLDPRATWPEGRYWIFVYLDDVKVGEETFEIVH